MKQIYLPAGLLLLIANAIMLVRLTSGDVRLSEMQPKIHYYLTLQMEATLHGDPASIKVFLPASNEYQTVSEEKIESSGLSYSLKRSGLNRRAEWTASGTTGHETAVYQAVLEIHAKDYQLPDGVPIPDAYPSEVARYLEATDKIQSDDPELRAKVDELLPPEGQREVAGVVRTLFDFVHQQIDGSDYENTLDALTTLRWKEAFCGGKSRLLVAMFRAANIPARMVGGLILTPGSKRITHAWTEAWINGVWVPFDALNDHYATHPSNYAILYYGDQVTFTRTANINFQYQFGVKRWRTAPDESMSPSRSSFLNPYVFWEAFRKAHISLNLLRIILLLPVGVLVVVLCRNVVGMTTFGTFHPALMAAAFRETGLLWGIALYVCLLLLGSVFRRLLDRVQLLHTPRLLIVLVFVVAFMLVATYVSVAMGNITAANVSLFPLAILTLTVESFFMKAVETGRLQALWTLVQTLLVATVAYVTMSSFALQSVIFVFPETLLAVVAASLVVGRWTGMRLSEYYRFRLLWADERASSR